MSSLQFEVRVSKSPELGARGIERATHMLSAGDLVGAKQAYQAAARAGLLHPASWSNLAALGVALGDPEGACQHARRALKLDARSSDAWVNFGVASWHAGRRRDAAQAMHQSLALTPGLEPAALNFCLMLRTVADEARAAEVLATALRDSPNSWRLQLAAAEQARLMGKADATRQHARAALRLLAPTLSAIAQDARQKPPSKLAEGHDVELALIAAREALGNAGIDFYLLGGTLLAIVRDGQPFPHDKDVDLGLPFDCDRNAIEAAFAVGYTPLVKPGSDLAKRSQAWAMGYIHDATGVGVDLMFAKAEEAGIRFELGWPDHLACVLPHYGLETLAWRGHDWLVPSPPAIYLTAIYGPAWQDAENREFDLHYFDTQVSNPSRTADSLPRAVNLALIRMIHALVDGNWAKAWALCVQVQKREPLQEVAAVAARLRKLMLA